MALEDSQANLGELLVELVELEKSPMKEEVVVSSAEQGGGSEPGLQVDEEDEECHLFQFSLLLPRGFRELMLE